MSRFGAGGGAAPLAGANASPVGDFRNLCDERSQFTRLEEPVRLDYFGDEIESLRDFDVDSQRTTGRRDSVDLLPMDLFPSGMAQAEALADALVDDPDVSGGLDLERRVEQLESGE